MAQRQRKTHDTKLIAIAIMHNWNQNANRLGKICAT